jgi:hypothetical protein
VRILYLDCFSGISGNMVLGALIDLGLPEENLRATLAKLPVSGYQLIINKVQKQGINATYVDVRPAHQHHHRHLPDIYRIIDNSALEQQVKVDAKKVFLRLAEAEAKVHGTTVDRIHFHEVGAVDAIVDIVGAVYGLRYLGIEKIITSPLKTGTGYVKCSHGRMPVPAPATAELLRGIPYESGDIQKELVTPTGAALLAALAEAGGGMPRDFISETIGYGAGTWDLDIPNVLRAVIGRLPDKAEECVVIEANIDDLNPQLYPYVIDKLLEAGARDAWLTPVIMKKGRPAIELSVLIDQDKLPEISGLIFRETSTIGIRYYSVARSVAQREMVRVSVAGGEVGVKVSAVQGSVCNIAPEYEDCRRLAEETGLPLKAVWQEVLSAAWQKCGRTGGPDGNAQS